MQAMSYHRTIVPIVLVLTGLAAPLACLAAACGEPQGRDPVVVPSDAHLASTGPAGAGGVISPTRPPALPAGVSGRLDAVRTVALYCRLIDQGQYARAGALCTRRRLWSRRAFASLRGLRFRSALVYAAPDARTLVLKARVYVLAGRGCPLPDGLATLFFTLGRVGSAVGGWLVTSVSTSP
jgi:hypothetical protein